MQPQQQLAMRGGAPPVNPMQSAPMPRYAPPPPMQATGSGRGGIGPGGFTAGGFASLPQGAAPAPVQPVNTATQTLPAQQVNPQQIAQANALRARR